MSSRFQDFIKINVPCHLDVILAKSHNEEFIVQELFEDNIIPHKNMTIFLSLIKLRSQISEFAS